MIDLSRIPKNTPMIIVVGPSGVGKSSFVELVCKDFPALVDTVTYTTRQMRPGESEGNPYHFVSEDRFKSLIEQEFFIEFAQVHRNFYGTPRHQIDEAIEAGKVVIMDVDVQGAKTFKEKYPKALSIFIHPPSIDELRQRVLKRDGIGAKDLDVRMANALKEIGEASFFDVEMTNDDFENSYSEFKKIVEHALKNR